MSTAYRLGGWRRDRDDDAGEDRTHLEAVRARLARMRILRATKSVEALSEQWPDDPANVLESLLLRRRLESERGSRNVD